MACAADLLLDRYYSEFISETKASLAMRHVWVFHLKPWGNSKKQGNEKRIRWRQWGRSREEVHRTGEQGGKKDTAAKQHSFPSEEQMSLFFISPHAAFAASTWERRGKREEMGRLSGGTCGGSGLMSTAAWMLLHLWTKNTSSPGAWLNIRLESFS